MKKIFFFILGFSLVPFFASADIGQIADSSTATPNSTALGATISGNIASKGQRLGTGITGTAASTTIYISDTGGLGAITPAITIECYDDSAYSSYNASCSLASVTLGAQNGSPKTLRTVSTVLTFNSNKYYRLGVGCIAGCSGGTNPNLITYGSASDLWAGGDFSSSMNITDLYFQITGTGVAANDAIAISTPADGGSVFEPSLFGGTYTISPSSTIIDATNGVGIKVRYGRSTSTWEHEDSYSYGAVLSAGSWVWSMLKTSITYPSSTYYAIANLGYFDYSAGFDNPVFYSTATSSIISWYQMVEDNSIDVDTLCASYPAPTSTSIFSSISVDNLKHVGCVVLGNAFLPSSSSLALFSDLKDELSTKPPFGYVTAYTSAFSSSTLLGGTASVVVSDPQISLLDTFKTTIVSILWVAFGFYVINRAKHFDW